LKKRTKISDIYRNINEFKKGYKPRTSLENVRIMIFLESCIFDVIITCQLLDVYGVNVRQAEMHTAEPIVPEPNSFGV
jgi:hypothetical protein